MSLKSILLGAVVVLSASCNSDWLEVAPYGKSDATTYYQTDEEIAMGLIAAYDIYHSDQLFGWSSLTFVKQLPADDTNCGGGGSSDQGQYQKIDDFDWSPENPGIRAYFQELYFGIYRANLVITNSNPQSDVAKRMVAEAKALRAMYYFDLTTAFGDVPLRLEPAATLYEGIARAPQTEVYAQIEKDLTEAIAVLPNKNDYTGGDRFRISKQAAQALLGKVHLYQEEWNDALTALNAVIATEGSQVGLEPDFSNLSKKESEWGVESLFEVSFTITSDTWGTTQWNRNAHDNRHIQLSGPRGPFNGGTSGINDGWGFMPPTQKLYNAFEAADPRRLQTVISTAELASLYGGSFVDGWDTEGMIRTKYTTFQTETNMDPSVNKELNYGTNWRLLRYADVLLMAAEAAHKAGNDANALVQLNKVRARVGLAPSTATGSALFSAIVKERQVELAYEGHRYWDLVRWGLANQELGALGFTSGKHEHFPIPLDEINANPLVTQNVGY